MNTGNPQVKKRLYTLLMDVYRHKNIYIPGFNFAARSILKAKAESAYSTVSRKHTENQADIEKWLANKKLFFGFGVFRSGTTFLADFLNRYAQRALVQHEPNVNDYWYYAKAIQSSASATDYIQRYRLAEIYFRTRDLEFDTYGEINPFLRRHCAAMKLVFPRAKLFQIVRDPRNVLRSLMSRELFSKNDPMSSVIHPPDNDPVSCLWLTMSRFEKLCWLWAGDNQFIRENTDHLVKFENLRANFEYFDANILKYLGLELSADDWHAEIGKVYNFTPKYTFPKYADWSAGDKRSFDRICGQEMAIYGY